MSIPLICAGTAGARCGVTLSLTVMETLNRGKVIAVSAARQPRRTKTVVLARANVTLDAGQSRTVKLTLDSVGASLLARFHRLSAKLLVDASGTAVLSKALSFSAAKPRRP